MKDWELGYWLIAGAVLVLILVGGFLVLARPPWGWGVGPF